jgi:glycosyltransferase involved in cell wall biosynthesis
MKKVDIISFHPGRQHNLDQAFQIHRHFSNYRHITSLYFDPKTVGRWSRISGKIGAALKKRSAALTSKVVTLNPWEEIKFLLRRRMGQKTKNYEYIDRNGAFQQWIIKRFAPPKVCIGYDTSSWVVFEQWKNKSFLILDLSIAVPQYKLDLAKQYHCSQEFISAVTQDDATFYQVYEKELQLADLILCGSSFVGESCRAMGVPAEKIMVLPYGADLNRFQNPSIQRTGDGIIRVVFVGFVNYRKGADTVIKAWQNIMTLYPHVELHFYGGVLMDIPEGLERVYFHGFIAQDALIEDLKKAHISVLPSFFEGSSLAIYQSMAMGLAVITTPNAGSVVTHEEDGLIVPYGSVERFQNAVQLLIEDEQKRKEMAKKAQQNISRYSWDNYGDKLKSIIEKGMDHRVAKQGVAALEQTL